jgi:hypothetical protein
MKVTMDKNCEEVADQNVTISLASASNQKVSGPPIVSGLCQHIFLVGNRKGQQCTTKPKGGNNKCCAHKTKVKKTDANRSDSDASSKNKYRKKIISKSECDSESDEKKKVPGHKKVSLSEDSTDEDEQQTKKVQDKKQQRKKVPLSLSEHSTDEDEPIPKKKVMKKKVPPTSGSESD